MMTLARCISTVDLERDNGVCSEVGVAKTDASGDDPGSDLLGVACADGDAAVGNGI